MAQACDSAIELDQSAVEINRLLSETVELSSDSESESKESEHEPDEKLSRDRSMSEVESDDEYDPHAKPANQSKERSLRSSTSVPIRVAQYTY